MPERYGRISVSTSCSRGSSALHGPPHTSAGTGNCGRGRSRSCSTDSGRPGVLEVPCPERAQGGVRVLSHTTMELRLSCEISWRKHHKYLTLVSNHDTSKIVWGAAGKDTATLDKFFSDLPDGAAAGIEAVSMDMGPAYAKSVRKPEPAPQAVTCFDPFHVVKLATAPWKRYAARYGRPRGPCRTSASPRPSRAPAGRC